ncbi:MAG: hypothetical protein RRY79_03670 [Clostridia bacterium]
MAVTKVYREGQYLNGALPNREPSLPQKSPGQLPRKRPIERSAPRNTLKKAAAVFSLLMVTGIALLILMGYASINKDYSSLNEIKANVAETERYIDKLKREIEYDISNGDIEKAVSENDMCYPEDNRIIKVEP